MIGIRIVLFLALLLGWKSIGQQIVLEGQVSIHNSKYETGSISYVDNTFVRAPFTKPATSDSRGRFSLEFVGLDPGTAVKLDADKQGLEVVNAYDLQEVIISRKLPLRIYLIDKGKLAEAQTELYNISKEALYARKDALIDRLRQNDAESKKAMKELEEFFGHPIDNRHEAESELIERIQALEKRLPQYAQNLAQQNLDFASERYIKAYEFFKNGEIEKAIQTLDSLSLQKDYQEAISNIDAGNELVEQGQDLREKGNEQLRQLIESYKLKARSHDLLFQYGEVVAIQNRLVKIYEDNDLDKKELAELKLMLAISYFEDGKYEASRKGLDSYLKLIDSLPGDWRLERATAYAQHGAVSERLRQYNQAIEYQEQAIAIKKEILDSSDLSLAESYNTMGLVYTRLGDTTAAKKYLFDGLEIRQSQLDSNHVLLSQSYNDIALLYQQMRNFPKAIVYDQKALKIRQSALESNHPYLALTYSNLGFNHWLNTDYYIADEYYQKAAQIREQILDANHPDLAMTYDNMARNYSSMSDYERSLEYNKKVFNIWSNNYGVEDKRMSSYYRNLGSAYRNAGRKDSAVVYTMKALELVLKRVDSNHRAMRNYYGAAYLAHLSAENFDQALDYAKKNLAVRELHYANNPRVLKQGYSSMSSAYNGLKNYQKGLEYQLKAYDLGVEGYGENHPFVGLDAANLAYCYYLVGEYKKALAHQEEALAIFANNYKPTHFYIVRGTIRMGVFHAALSDNNKARQYSEQAHRLIEQIEPENRRDLPELLNALDKDIAKNKQ